jgi:hypothetical protein
MTRYFLFLYLFLGCTANKKVASDFDRVNYNGYFIVNGKTVEKSFQLKIPNGGVLQKLRDMDGYDEYRINYSDSSVIYITNNSWSGSRLNYKNRFDAGIKTISRSENDTLRINGVQQNGRLWEERFVGQVVVGYVNLKPKNKTVFDEALSTLQERK